MVIVVSNFNNIRVLDGATGAIQYSRTVQPPVMSYDVGCGDVQTSIGIATTYR